MDEKIKTPLLGSGCFQWNAWGWFGSTIGGSSWLFVITCVLLYFQQTLVALLPASAFALLSAISYLLWFHRDRIYPFSAMMGVLGYLALVFPVVWCFVQSKMIPEVRTAINWPDSFWPNILYYSLIVPFLMLLFCTAELVKKRSKRRPNSQSTNAA